LIGFMLGDLRTRLQAVGRLDVLDQVGDRAMAYFAAVPETSLSDEELSRQSQAIYQVGQVRLAQGELEPLAASDPSNPDWQLGLINSHFYVGQVQQRQGNFAGALAHFSAYRNIAQALVEREPDNWKYQLELSYGYSNVASVMEANRDLEGAKDGLEHSIQIKERLFRDGHIGPSDLATGYARLGVILDKVGAATAAIENFSRAVELREQLVSAEPGHPRWKRLMAIDASQLGGVFLDAQRPDAARPYFDKSVAAFADLVALDPENADWQEDYARMTLWVGVLDRIKGYHGSARLRLGRAQEMFDRFIKTAPTVYVFSRDAARARIELGASHLATGNSLEALAKVASARDILNGVVRPAGLWR
jgi:serine/threonine-protein kinase